MSKIALLDVDGMVHAAGALGEEVYYVVHGIRFDYKSQANEHCDTELIDRKEIERKVDVMPAGHAVNILKQTVKAAVESAGCSDYEAYLSPTDRSNFRFDVDPEYKANRKNVVKPVHFDTLRSHCIQHMGAKVCTGMEADDMLAIRAHELGMDNVVIVSVDKDMRQVPCWHFDWRKKTPVIKQDEFGGWACFYTQLLTGDSVDNIKGCPKVGPAKAAKALKECQTEEEMLNACMAEYQKAYDGDADEAKKMMQLNAQLLLLLTVRP